MEYLDVVDKYETINSKGPPYRGGHDDNDARNGGRNDVRRGGSVRSWRTLCRIQEPHRHLTRIGSFNINLNFRPRDTIYSGC